MYIFAMQPEAPPLCLHRMEVTGTQMCDQRDKAFLTWGVTDAPKNIFQREACGHACMYGRHGAI